MDSIVTLVFSKDRPMQLDLLLRSMDYCEDSRHDETVSNVIVLYKASNPEHALAYSTLMSEFPYIMFIEETDFVDNVRRILNKFDYVLFCVDDTIFTSLFRLSDIIKVLKENPSVLGFSLRLGYNTDYCYSLDVKNTMPKDVKLNDYMFMYNWTSIDKGDFNYPLEVSSSVYRVMDILPLINELFFANPNMLEYLMSINTHVFAEEKPMLACYYNSVAFSNPINKVNPDNKNRSALFEDKCSTKNLTEMYNDGYRVNHRVYYGLASNSCHYEVGLYFKNKERLCGTW